MISNFVRDGFFACLAVLALLAPFYALHWAYDTLTAPLSPTEEVEEPSLEARYSWFVKKEKARLAAECKEELADPSSSHLQWRREQGHHAFRLYLNKAQGLGYAGWTYTHKTIPTFEVWQQRQMPW